MVSKFIRQNLILSFILNLLMVLYFYNIAYYHNINIFIITPAFLLHEVLIICNLSYIILAIFFSKMRLRIIYLFIYFLLDKNRQSIYKL